MYQTLVLLFHHLFVQTAPASHKIIINETETKKNNNVACACMLATINQSGTKTAEIVLPTDYSGMCV